MMGSAVLQGCLTLGLVLAAAAPAPAAGEAGGSSSTTSQTHNGARLTFTVDAHTDAVRGGRLA